MSDPLAGREPTAHERMAGQPWDASYTGDEPAPWDIGRPQPAVARLVSEGRFTGPVLDAGCGSGENALLIASAGLPVLGFDVAGTALDLARGKAADLGLDAEFVAADALDLRLDRSFSSVLDCGLFHALDLAERALYLAGLASVTSSGGTLFLLCFSDGGPDTGPHPVSLAELTSAFDGPLWTLVDVETTAIETNFHDEPGGPGWLAVITRN